MSNSLVKPSFREALRFWIKLGFISFGGPVGQIAILHNYLVEQKKWISEYKFLHALNYCMLLPGPEAQQLATYMGWLLHGKKGGIWAGLLFILPSTFLLAFLSIVYVKFGNAPMVAAFFNGIKPAMLAIVILALHKIGGRSLKSSLHIMIAAAAFICIYIFNIAFPIIIVSAIVIAWIIYKYIPKLLPIQKDVGTKGDETLERSYIINKYSGHEQEKLGIISVAKKICLGLLLWGIPFLLFYMFTKDLAFWNQLSLFFTKAALVTFGGAYAVLPYVAQISVEKFHWLSQQQMLDGLALGESTPGPLIIILAFVGFMAGYHHFDASVLMGLIALLVTVYYTFLPSFLFILIGAPIIEQTQENKAVKEILSIVNAAIVGVVLNLTIYLAKGILWEQADFSGPFHMPMLIWALVSIVALYRYKVNMIKWIFVSGIVGLIYFFFEYNFTA